MAAINNLSEAVTKLSASVDEAVAVIKTPGANDGDIQSAADTVNAVNDRLRAALTEVNPPNPVPEPPPETLSAAQLRSAQARVPTPLGAKR